MNTGLCSVKCKIKHMYVGLESSSLVSLFENDDISDNNGG